MKDTSMYSVCWIALALIFYIVDIFTGENQDITITACIVMANTWLAAGVIIEVVSIKLKNLTITKNKE